MIAASGPEAVVVGHDIAKQFRRKSGEIVHALEGVSFQITPGSLAALVGPDGAGKTTLLRLATGLLVADHGDLRVLGVDVARDPQAVQSRIAYMPQRFGLYEDLTVQENLDLYADLNAVPVDTRPATYGRLMEMTALGPFTKRLAGRLSGGMKQKLGLACTLVRAPDLLILDEPTVGVDPLSRRELWEILRRLVTEDHLSVLLSTSYLDEAQWCGYVLVMHEGRVLARGAPQDVSTLAAGRVYLAEPPGGQKARELQARLLDDPGVVDAVPEGGLVRVVCAEHGRGDAAPAQSLRGVRTTATPPRFEDGFMLLLRGVRTVHPGRNEPVPTTAALTGSVSAGAGNAAGKWSRSGEAGKGGDRGGEGGGREVDVQVTDLVRRFGTFTAVDHVSFEVRRGEIFGLAGPERRRQDDDLSHALRPAAGDLGYAAWWPGSICERARRRPAAANRVRRAEVLPVHPAVRHREPGVLRRRVRPSAATCKRERSRVGDSSSSSSSRWPICRADSCRADTNSGWRWRRRSCTSPTSLFLDEPTSGADPLARRDFWRRITRSPSGGDDDRDDALHGRGRILRPHCRDGRRSHIGAWYSG